jgi:hypothetical protein
MRSATVRRGFVALKLASCVGIGSFDSSIPRDWVHLLTSAVRLTYLLRRRYLHQVWDISKTRNRPDQWRVVGMSVQTKQFLANLLIHRTEVMGFTTAFLSLLIMGYIYLILTKLFIFSC